MLEDKVALLENHAGRNTDKCVRHGSGAEGAEETFDVDKAEPPIAITDDLAKDAPLWVPEDGSLMADLEARVKTLEHNQIYARIAMLRV